MAQSNNGTVVIVKTAAFVDRNTSLEDYDLSVKVISAFVGFVFVVFSIVAIIALNRTKHTPKTARFLSTGLIVYDVLTVTFYSVRKFIDHHEANIIIQVIGTNFNFLAYITVGVMSLERLVIFYSPNFYIKHMTVNKIKVYVSLIWLIIMVSYFYVRFGACYVAHENATLYDVVGKCNGVSFLYYGVFIFCIVVISILCYIKIFFIVRSDKSHNNRPNSLSATAKIFQNYKSTSLVFVYLVTVLITSLAYAVIISLGLETVPLRLSIDIVNMINCMMDPCMYVLWYSECRMEIMKMLSVFVPSLHADIEKMRIKIFYIVTSEKYHVFPSNKVHPTSIEETKDSFL